MKNMCGALYAHYRNYHAFGQPRLKYMGMLGLLALTGICLTRYTEPDPQFLEDIPIGLSAVLLMSLLALRDHWPARLRRHYIFCSYFVILLCLPCLTVLVALQRGGDHQAIANAFIMLCFLVLLTDWRNTLVMLLTGVGLASGIYVAITPVPRLPVALIAQMPAFALIVGGGSLFKLFTERMEARRLGVTRSLAGAVAHEMRRPLAQLRQSLDHILRLLPEPGQATQPQPPSLAEQETESLYRHLADSDSAVQRGLQVISLSLDAFQAQSPQAMVFTCLSAAATTFRAVQAYGYEDEDARLSVRLDTLEDFDFRVDEAAFRFVVFTLIRHALDARVRYPGIRLGLTVTPHQLKVRDTGPGMTPEALARLFEPDRAAADGAGGSLMLAHCRRVMRRHGGDITCVSIAGQFTEFTLTFPPVPLAEAESSRQALQRRARTLFQGRRILLVDADATHRQATRRSLAILGAMLDEAMDGNRALSMLEHEHYDLVLLDLSLAVLDGYALASHIRQGMVPANRHVTLVALTSEPEHIAALKIRKAGMDAFMNRTDDTPALLRTLCEALERPAATASTGLLSGCTLMVADDSSWNRKAVAALLRHAGAEVVEAAHGREVLDCLASRARWDAVVMDLNMPGMDGLATTRAIRASGQVYANVPVIALTAHSDPSLVQATREAGMNDFITKPVDPNLLYSQLCRLTGRAVQPLAASPDRSEPGLHGELLDQRRLLHYQRLGMIDELMSDYLPEMARLMDRLADAAARGELEMALDALHSLLGMSGEAGATALYLCVRGYYVPMVESQEWPRQADWQAEIRALAIRTEQALRHYAQGIKYPRAS